MQLSFAESLFNLAPTAETAKREAIDAVEAKANQEWYACALKVARWIAAERATFTANDVADAMAHTQYHTHDTRALGAVMMCVKRESIAEPTSEMAASGRIRNHSRPVRVWRSLIYRT